MSGAELTPEQRETLEGLLAVECKVDPMGCDNQWCTARNKIRAAFGLEEKAGGEA